MFNTPPPDGANYEIIIIILGLGRLTCSGIDALPSFLGVSAISLSSGFIVEGVFRESVVINSFKFSLNVSDSSAYALEYIYIFFIIYLFFFFLISSEIMWENMVRQMRLACWTTKDTDTHTDTYCFTTATMVTRTRFGFTSYVHCPCCLLAFIQ